jgi:NAD+ kinase
MTVAIAALTSLGAEPVTSYRHGETEPIDGAVVLGGDGTMLHAVEVTRGSGAPLLGVNFGRVGFLAEAERDDVKVAVEALANGAYTVEERRTVDVSVTYPDGSVKEGWALNEVAIERVVPHRTLEVIVEIDGQALSTFGCDGALIASATGSTAHAFSAGGPILWPDVDAILFVPLAAHALFSRPLVVGPHSIVGVRLAATSSTAGLVVCDGSRTLDLPREALVEVRRGSETVRLARLTGAGFTQRLIEKFSLPTKGWRGELDGDAPEV